MVVSAVNTLGINLEISGRNDLVHVKDGCNFKLSGSAFRDDTFNGKLHHGTMLVDVKFENLDKILTPSKAKLKSKGIDSVKSRVTNLSTLNPSITTLSFVNSLEQQYTK